MQVRLLSFRLALPVILVALVCVLAVCQYRWLGQASEAERAQLVRSLTQRASDVANAFDNELTQAYLAHQLSRDAARMRDWNEFAAGIERWRRAARFPQIVRAVYLAEPVGDETVLHRFDPTARGFSADTVPWPEHLEAVRKRLTLTGAVPSLAPLPAGKSQIVAIALTPAVVEAPALVIPLSPSTPLPAPPPNSASLPNSASGTVRGAVTVFGVTAAELGTCTIVDLDRDVLANTVLPALVEQSFPDAGADGYRVAVTSGDGQRVFARGIPAGESLDANRADVSQSFFAVRLDPLHATQPGTGSVVVRALATPPNTPGTLPKTPGTSPGGPPDGSTRMSIYLEQRVTTAGDGRGVTQFRVSTPSWRILVQHPAGSLDAAVSQVRRRNLWLSFGILAILATGVVMVVVTARRAERLAGQQMDFVATVSHELRTPLAVIRSAAQNLAAGIVSGSDQARQYGTLIDDEGRRLGEMVEQVLTLAGLESGRRLQAVRPVDVRALVDAELEACGPSCDAAGIAVEVTAGEDQPGSGAVMADEVALRRALHNLIGNAIKHGFDGKWIGVRVSTAPVKDGREVRIAVSDRGRGIDVADLPHVFEPFHRGRYAIEQQIQGSGLGLNLVKRIVDAHGGSVCVESTPGHGATFTISLPCVDWRGSERD